MLDYLRLVSAVPENDVNISNADSRAPVQYYLHIGGCLDSFPTSSLRYGSPTHLDGLVFTLEPMTTQTHSARLSHDDGDGLVFPGIRPLW